MHWDQAAADNGHEETAGEVQVLSMITCNLKLIAGSGGKSICVYMIAYLLHRYASLAMWGGLIGLASTQAWEWKKASVDAWEDLHAAAAQAAAEGKVKHYRRVQSLIFHTCHLCT